MRHKGTIISILGLQYAYRLKRCSLEPLDVDEVPIQPIVQGHPSPIFQFLVQKCCYTSEKDVLREWCTFMSKLVPTPEGTESSQPIANLGQQLNMELPQDVDKRHRAAIVPFTGGDCVLC